MAKKVSSGSLFLPRYTSASGEKRESSVYWLRFYDRKLRTTVRESTDCSDYEDALKVLRRRMSESESRMQTNLRAENCTIADLLDLTLEDYKRQGRASIEDVKGKIRLHLKPYFGAVKANGLTTNKVNAYIAARQREGAKPSSINRELAPLHRALVLGNQSVPQLVYSVFAFSKLREDNTREGILPAESYTKLRDALPEHLKLAFVIGYYTGVRRGELLAVQRDRVDLEAGRIWLQPRSTKNREGRWLPIYGEMRAWIEMQLSTIAAKYPNCPWLIHRRGLPLRSFYKAWDTATEAAGVPGLLFHDLRRTALTAMEEAGIPRSVATAISGHKTEAVYRRYLIRRSEALDKAADTMATWHTAAQAKAAAKPTKRTGVN